jgi:hypothetical protein
MQVKRHERLIKLDYFRMVNYKKGQKEQGNSLEKTTE